MFSIMIYTLQCLIVSVSSEPKNGKNRDELFIQSSGGFAHDSLRDTMSFALLINADVAVICCSIRSHSHRHFDSQLNKYTEGGMF